jgi:flagellar assembly protein FliH
MAFVTLRKFSQPLSGAVVRNSSARVYTQAEVDAIRVAAERKGAEAARDFADRQLVEFRAEVRQLQDGVLRRLANADEQIRPSLQAALPALALDLARHLMAGYEPAPEAVERLCAEALQAVCPEHENLELSVCPRDAAIMEKVAPGWTARFPGLRLRSDQALAPGECQVRSRFGLTDASHAARLAGLQQALHA